MDQTEFFKHDTPLEQMRGILDRYQAEIIIINRNTAYNLYGIPMSSPETIGKLSRNPLHFTKIYDKNDWAIFLYKTQKQTHSTLPNGA